MSKKTVYFIYVVSSFQKEYSICFSLDNLKEKYMIFNICKTLEDAYKIFMNLFNNEKAQISKPENPDSIYLNLTIPNYIEKKKKTIMKLWIVMNTMI